MSTADVPLALPPYAREVLSLVKTVHAAKEEETEEEGPEEMTQAAALSLLEAAQRLSKRKAEGGGRRSDTGDLLLDPETYARVSSPRKRAPPPLPEVWRAQWEQEREAWERQRAFFVAERERWRLEALEEHRRTAKMAADFEAMLREEREKIHEKEQVRLPLFSLSSLSPSLFSSLFSFLSPLFSLQ